MRRKNKNSGVNENATIANQSIKLCSLTDSTLDSAQNQATKFQAAPNQAAPNQAAPNQAAPEQTGTDQAARTHSVLRALPHARISGADDISFVSISSSARHIMPGDLAVYRIGQDDPAKIVADSMARGAAGIITEQLLPSPLPQCIVGDLDLALASLESDRLDHPDRKLLTIGVVGSSGKTTTSLLLSQLFRSQNIRTAYQTDLGASDGVVSDTPEIALPSASELVQWLGESVDCEAQVAVIEVQDDDARHGRYDAIEFDMVVVTGSPSQEDDFGPAAISCVLDNLHHEGVVVYPADDARASRAVLDTGLQSVSYGVRSSADLTAKIIDQSNGMSTLLLSHEETTAAMETPLVGGAMAANHAAAAMVGLLVEIPIVEIAEQLGTLRTVPGRGQRFETWGHVPLIVDVAGNAKRCESALRAARSMKNGGRLWVIATITDSFDDPMQLARLGTLVEKFADNVVVTTTADRKQSFLKSSHAILDGVQECAAMRLVADSRRALRWAMDEARPTDTILWLTNQSFASANEERTELAAIEAEIDRQRSEIDAGDTRPKLKIFS